MNIQLSEHHSYKLQPFLDAQKHQLCCKSGSHIRVKLLVSAPVYFCMSQLNFRTLSELCAFLVRFISRHLIYFWSVVNGGGYISFLLRCNKLSLNSVAKPQIFINSSFFLGYAPSWWLCLRSFMRLQSRWWLGLWSYFFKCTISIVSSIGWTQKFI